MRAALFEEPLTPEDWLRWSFHNLDSHDRIRAAIAVKGLNLPPYPIDPISSQHIMDFLQNNAQLHSDMNGATGQQSSDLLSVDLNDKQQRLAWIELHAKEHENAELALGI